MKKIIAFIQLITLSVLTSFLFSCENPTTDKSESNDEMGKINYVNIAEVPFLIPTIQKFNPDYAFLSDPTKVNNKETLNLNLDLTSILEYIGIDGRKTYSIKILHEFNEYDDKYLENIHIYKENEEYKSFIVKFNSLDDAIPFDVNTFTGDAEIYDIERELQSINNYENGNLRCNKIINGPWHIWIHNGTIDVWYDESWSGGGVDTSALTNEFVFLAQAPPAPGDSGGGGSMSSNLEVILFLDTLSEEQLSIVQNHPEIVTYLENSNASQDSREFTLELIDLAINEPNKEDVNNLINLTILIENSGNQFFTDEFALSLDPYVSLDLANIQSDQELPPLSTLTIKTFLNYKRLRTLNPEWSRAKCIWYASRDIVHMSLDLFGLIPVGGEVADLTNGVLYLIEGDNINATLSVASAVPVAGWAAVGVKYAVKINEVASIGAKVKLVWKVSGDLISFGSSNQLRKVLGLLPGDLRQAHHLIPWSSRTKMAVQRAAKSGNAFHMNEALNGIPVAAWRNQPNHQAYNDLINSKLDEFRDDFPNATPDQCYTFLTNLIDQIRTWVINNPNKHLNELVLP